MRGAWWQGRVVFEIAPDREQNAGVELHHHDKVKLHIFKTGTLTMGS